MSSLKPEPGDIAWHMLLKQCGDPADCGSCTMCELYAGVKLEKTLRLKNHQKDANTVIPVCETKDPA